MGWTSYHLNEEWKNGKCIIDRKAECDRILTQIEDPEMQVLKSAMVGDIYYAAVKTTDKGDNSHIWAAVFPTRIDPGLYCNFAYKAQDETCGPFEVQCPEEILHLLTDIDSEYAKEWRERCLRYHESKKNSKLLNDSPKEQDQIQYLRSIYR